MKLFIIIFVLLLTSCQHQTSYRIISSTEANNLLKLDSSFLEYYQTIQFELFKLENSTVIIHSFTCGAGGSCGGATAYLLDESGKTIEAQKIKSENGDLQFSDDQFYLTDSLGSFLIYRNLTEYDAERNVISIKEDKYILLLNNSNWIKEPIDTLYISDLKRRLVQNTSDTRLLNAEIYARNGYIFEDKELFEYFSRFKWYHPLFKNKIPTNLLYSSEWQFLMR